MLFGQGCIILSRPISRIDNKKQHKILPYTLEENTEEIMSNNL